MNNYKRILIPTQERTERITKLKNAFNNRFDKKYVYLDLSNDGLELFINRIDVQRLKDITKELNQNYATNIFDDVLKRINNIKSYGLNGKKRNFVDYNKERKVQYRKTKEIKRGKYYYAKDNPFSKENNAIPTDYINKIIEGDSKQVLKKLPDNCVDLVFTSPPYNFGLDYSNNPDDQDWNLYFEKLFQIFDETIRVLKWGGRIIVNLQPLFSDYIPSHHIISKYFMDKKLIWKGEILWEKNNYNCKYTAWGSWKSPSSPYLKYTWEFLEIFCKGDLKKGGKRDNIDITGDEFKDWVVAKWSIAPERNMKKYDHPAMFPEKLVERVLKLFSFKGDIVLDPFNGVGSTTAVANKTNRNYLGIDVSKDYCEKAKDRISNIVRQEGLF